MKFVKPNWIGEPATKGQQIAMWFVFALVAGGELLTIKVAIEQRSLGYIFKSGPPGWLLLVGGLYVSLFSLYIARKGKTPSGWMPW